MHNHRALTCAAVLLALMAACAPLLPPPDDFPQPPWTPIVEFPTSTLPPTAVPRPRLKPIVPSDMDDARAFFLVTEVAITAGDPALIADRILYPIRVNLNGSPTKIASAAQFARNYEGIFNDRLQQALVDADEQDLDLLPDGVRAADGALSFNQFCLDAACTQAGFLITQINN